MQNVQDSLQPSCTLTNARLCSVISVIGTSRKLFAVEIGDTATTGGPVLEAVDELRDPGAVCGAHHQGDPRQCRQLLEARAGRSSRSRRSSTSDVRPRCAGSPCARWRRPVRSRCRCSRRRRRRHRARRRSRSRTPRRPGCGSPPCRTGSAGTRRCSTRFACSWPEDSLAVRGDLLRCNSNRAPADERCLRSKRPPVANLRRRRVRGDTSRTGRPHDTPARSSRRRREPRIDPDRADCGEHVAGVHQRNAPALPRRDSERLETLLERASPHTQRSHPSRIVSADPHRDPVVPDGIVEPSSGAGFPGETSVIQRERFRDAPAAHDPGGDRWYPGDQPNAAPETPDLYVSETDARHRIRPRLDHLTGDLPDSTRPGRRDAPGPQPAGDGVAPSRRLERPDHRDVERFAADSAGRFEVDGGQRIEQVGGFTAVLPRPAPASTATRAIASRGRESPPGAA